jgi:CRISPR-associated protein Csb1
MSNGVQSLTYDQLRAAVADKTAAIRSLARLEPAGGAGDKVFPPTYAGGVYAVEQRRIDGEVLPCVLLDSVQSQANRMEESLLRAYEASTMRFPLIVVDFSRKEDGNRQDDEEIARIGRITALDAPHRIADAILRDSVLHQDGQAAGFRDTPEGSAFELANIRDATALFELCPTALVFGTWDSTGSRGGLGNKFARCLVSEMIGVNAVPGVRTGSRIDPLGIEKCALYAHREGGWTAREDEGIRDADGNLVLFKSRSGKGNPSAVNHGNVTPDFSRYQTKDVTDDNRKTPDPLRSDGGNIEVGRIKAGGVSISHALQISVLSLAGLRRLRFPGGGGCDQIARNNAARTVLAAIGLAAMTHVRESGCDLRSRCVLVPSESASPLEVIVSGSDRRQFSLTAAQARELFRQAVAEATSPQIGLPWRTVELVLFPSDRLVDLVRAGRRAAAGAAGEEATDASS